MRAVALTALWLAIAPARGESGPAESAPPEDARAEGALSEGAAVVLDELEKATYAATEAEGIEALEDALAQASAYAAEFAYHPEALDIRERASFALVYALLNAEPPREDEAAARMDEAIRSAQGRSLELSRFGPTLVDFHAARLERLRARGTAEIVVDCAMPCRVTINERARSTYPSVLLLGDYRVHVESRDGELGIDVDVALTRAGDIAEVQFPAPAPPLAPRLARWQEIVLLTASAGVVAGGGAALGQHNRCVGDPELIWYEDYDASACARLVNTAGIGGTLVGVGVVGIVTMTYLLIDDEQRRRRLKAVPTSGGMGWSIAF